jgi:3'-phosphoadenosine 5'-phosphosulfate (PAPS) 3'-phosphatase
MVPPLRTGASPPRTGEDASATGKRGQHARMSALHDLAIARQAAAEAGALALGMQGAVRRETKTDGSPVSEADRAADAVVRHHLGLHDPGFRLLSEEDEDDASGGRTWILDPIDGTRAYLDGGGDWCVQLALAIDGVPVLGVVDLPAHGVRISGVAGMGAWIEDADGIRQLAAPTTALDRLVTSGSGRNAALVGRLRETLPEFAWYGMDSVGVKVWHLLTGRADLYIHGRAISAWDAGAPAAVLLAAGGCATDLAGRPLRLGGRTAPSPGLMCSIRNDHAALAARLAAAGMGV